MSLLSAISVATTSHSVAIVSLFRDIFGILLTRGVQNSAAPAIPFILYHAEGVLYSAVSIHGAVRYECCFCKSQQILDTGCTALGVYQSTV